MRDCIALALTETSQVGEARRLAVALATELGLNETERGKVAIVVTEAAKNLIKHARNGELILQALPGNRKQGLEVLAVDQGPGMENLSQCLQDGFSTVGTPGTGLGAMQRLAGFFDIYSTPETGTALVAQFGAGQLPSPLELGVIHLPKLGQEVSGDAWTVANQPERHLILVADGLGSGPAAAAAAQQAIEVLHTHASASPKSILELAHPALQRSRGAAVAIAELNFSRQRLCYAGVGNIAGVLYNSSDRYSLISVDGTVGYQIHKIVEFTHPWVPGSLLILHSDGLGSQWSLERYPGLLCRHPALIAAILYRDFKRSRDDVTVLVARNAP